MDNEMIVDFINNVEPDFSYGTSDGMSRAMVESAENIATINEYINESVYDVYNEMEFDANGNAIVGSGASDKKDDDSSKPGFFGKLYNKIDTYFQLFMRLVKKFITKIKGFFMTIKRKITVAFTKAIKAVGNFLRNRINNNKKKFDATEKEGIEIYEWNPQVITSIISGNYFDSKLPQIMNNMTARGPSDLYELAKDMFSELKEMIDDIAVAPEDGKKETLLSKKTVHFTPNQSEKFLQQEYKVNIDGKINQVYNAVMKETSASIKDLKTAEKEIRKQFKKSSNKDDETRNEIKTAFKAINYAINQSSLIKYRVSQKIATAAFKYYKKLFTAVRKVFGGINIFGNSGDYKEPKSESAIFDLIQ